MDTFSMRLFIWFLVGVCFSLVLIPAYATDYPVRISGVSASPSGPVYRPAPGVVFVTPSFNTINTARMPVTITQAGGVTADLKIAGTLTANAARVGAAVGTLARFSGPVGLGLQLLPIICAETSICDDTQNHWVVKKSDPNSLENGAHTAHDSKGLIKGSCTVSNGDRSNCDYLLAHCWENCPWTVDANADSHDPAWSPTTTTSSASDADWSDAISKLSSAANSLQKLSDMVQGLLGKGQAIPIDNPVLSPSSITTAPVSTVIRDSAGNVIKTVTESVTYNSSPTNIYDNSYNPITNITSIVNSTFTDNTTNITTTTTTTNDSPPVDSPPDDPSVEFDTVDDVDLPTQSLPDMATPVSWGEGTCPADPVATVFGHPIPIPVHVVCTYMSGVRTAVILLFSLIAAYIVIGVKFEG